MGELDINPLIKACESLFKALEFAKILESEFSDSIVYAEEGGRAAVIQHFEYTYELSWKIMKRYIELEDGKLDGFSNKTLLRIAGEKGLIDDFHKWREFHKARNLTSHTYDEEIASEVYDIAKEFAIYMKKLILGLEDKIKDL
ncbi:MAG: nucleotidyltransferase [Methanobrevibacter sp. CfCl-M3]